MRLARESAYGIEGLLNLATKPPGTAMLLRDIASARGVPQSFLAKIFQKLTRYGIVRSFRGAGRGYALARPPKEIKLKEILLAIEGPDIFERCIFWSDRCADSNPCPLHQQWKQIKEKVFGKLVEQTTLADLIKKTAASRGTKRPFLPWGREAGGSRRLSVSWASIALLVAENQALRHLAKVALQSSIARPEGVSNDGRYHGGAGERALAQLRPRDEADEDAYRTLC